MFVTIDGGSEQKSSTFGLRRYLALEVMGMS